MTDTTDRERRLREDAAKYVAGRKELLAAADALKQQRETIAELLEELDEASPRQTCARCGKEFRWHQMIPEEGNEWECYPCNDRENARERADAARRGSQEDKP